MAVGPRVLPHYFYRFLFLMPKPQQAYRPDLLIRPVLLSDKGLPNRPFQGSS